MSWNYEYFNVSGYTTGNTGIQINESLYLQVSGLKYDGTTLTNIHLEYLTGLGFITSGITEISGSFFFNPDFDHWESILSISDAGEVGNQGSGTFEWDFNSGAVNEHYADNSTGVKVYANSAADAWDTLTYENDSVDNADLLHSHAAGAIEIDGSPADATYNGIVLDIDTTSCATYDAVYIDGVNSVLPADADSINTMPAIGIVVAAGKVLTHGVVRSDAVFALAAASKVYVSTTPGDLTTTPPAGVGDIVQVFGITVGADMIFVNPSLDWVERV